MNDSHHGIICKNRYIIRKGMTQMKATAFLLPAYTTHRITALSLSRPFIRVN